MSEGNPLTSYCSVNLVYSLVVSQLSQFVSRSTAKKTKQGQWWYVVGADDTRVGHWVKTREDLQNLQKDLDNIYEWATKNNTEFNSSKFESL